MEGKFDVMSFSSGAECEWTGTCNCLEMCSRWIRRQIAKASAYWRRVRTCTSWPTFDCKTCILWPTLQPRMSLQCKLSCPALSIVAIQPRKWHVICDGHDWYENKSIQDDVGLQTPWKPAWETRLDLSVADRDPAAIAADFLFDSRLHVTSPPVRKPCVGAGQRGG